LLLCLQASQGSPLQILLSAGEVLASRDLIPVRIENRFPEVHDLENIESVTVRNTCRAASHRKLLSRTQVYNSIEV
jgi:hypothetical protein